MAESLLEKLKSKSLLPSPPGTALQILRLCQDEDVSLAELADTLSADPALSLRLLRYSNSSLFGVRKEVTNLRDAVVLLGMRAVRLMALSFSLITHDDPRACKNFNFGKFWSYSLACAVAARHLAKLRRQVHPEEAFAAALLAKIGKLVFAVGMPQEYAAVLNAGGGTLGDTTSGEMAAFGTAYPQMGADLMRDWGIPQKMARAIEHQLAPEGAGNDNDVRHLAALIGAGSKIADLLCDLVPAEAVAAAQENLAGTVLASLPVSPEEALGAIREEFAGLAGTLKLPEGKAPNVRQIEAEAGQVIGTLSRASNVSNEVLARHSGDLDGSCTDEISGVFTRAAFHRKTSQIWSDSARSGRPLAILLVDVDGFKAFNDLHGRPAGDTVLRLVATALRQVVRERDLVARYRADEFIVALPQIDRVNLAQLCVRLRKLVEAAIIDIAGRQHHISISIGAALLSRCDPPFTLSELIQAASRELMAARAKGGNSCGMRVLQPAPAGV